MADPQRPNVLLIMTDQQRGDALSIDGHPALLTPNMDHLAASGCRFTRAYTTCPTCVPARRCLMSGQHAVTTGMVGYQDGVEWEQHPPLLPEVLRDAGYQTVLVGRSMHLSPPRKRYGYEQLIQIDHRHMPSEYARFLAEHAPESVLEQNGTGTMHNDWTARPWHLDEALHNTNWTVREALRWLELRDETAPFFLTVSFLAPHPPLVPPAFYFDRYMNMDLPEPVIGDWVGEAPRRLGASPDASRINLAPEHRRAMQAGYYGSINHVDDQIRLLLNPVLGIDRMTGGNTLVIFTSDHGEMLGDHHYFRKTVPYEGSARIPMIVRPPHGAGIGADQVIDHLACLEDVMPTILDFAGLDIPSTVEGRSLLPLMRGEKPAWRPQLHIEHAPVHQTLVDDRYKFIWWAREGREQLFDLQQDPSECHDLIDDPGAASVRDDLRARLIARLADRPEGFVQDGKLMPGRPYKAAMAHASGRAE